MFSSIEILEEFADATALQPGAQVWNLICEKALTQRRLSSRRRYERWICIGRNQDKKRKYMKAYDQLPLRKIKKNLDSARRRAARPKAPKVRTYKDNGVRVESKETRRLRYLRAKETGYLSRSARIVLSSE